MAALKSQCRCLAGSRAFTGLRPRQFAAVANGTMATMKRKDSYMVEVNVGEDEPEDIAVRRFMKKVMDSRVIEQLRARRYKETPLQEFKRRTRERIERIKNKVVEPTWDEEYGFDVDPKPFQEFFQDDAMPGADFNDSSFLVYGQEADFLNQGGYLDAGANGAGWGSYVSTPSTARYNTYAQGGYMAPAQDTYQQNYQQPAQQVAPPAQ